MIFGGIKQSFWTLGFLNCLVQNFYLNWSLTLKTKSCFVYFVLYSIKFKKILQSSKQLNVFVLGLFQSDLKLYIPEQAGIELGLNQAETVSQDLTNYLSPIQKLAFINSIVVFHFTASKSDLVDQLCFLQHQQV